MDVGLHHCRGQAQPAAADHLLLACERDHPGVQLLDHLRTQRQSKLPHGLGIGDLVRPHPRELPIDQVCAHLALEHAGLCSCMEWSCGIICRYY